MSPGVRKLLARILRSRGYDVFETEDGPLQRWHCSTAPTVKWISVVTDLVMPKMSGARLAEEIQTRWPAVKLLFVSGFPRGRRPTGRRTSANVPVLHKPFTSQQIEKTVRDVGRLRRRLASRTLSYRRRPPNSSHPPDVRYSSDESGSQWHCAQGRP